MEFMGGLDSDDILHILHDADLGGVAAWGGADRAELLLADVMTSPAVTDVAPEVGYGFAEGDGHILLLSQKMEREPQGGLMTDSRQASQMGDGVVEESGII